MIPYRKIVQEFRISQHGFGISHGTATDVVLDCGHRKMYPTSHKPKIKARCRECYFKAQRY